MASISRTVPEARVAFSDPPKPTGAEGSQPSPLHSGEFQPAAPQQPDTVMPSSRAKNGGLRLITSFAPENFCESPKQISAGTDESSHASSVDSPSLNETRPESASRGSQPEKQESLEALQFKMLVKEAFSATSSMTAPKKIDIAEHPSASFGVIFRMLRAALATGKPEEQDRVLAVARKFLEKNKTPINFDPEDKYAPVEVADGDPVLSVQEEILRALVNSPSLSRSDTLRDKARNLVSLVSYTD